MSTVSNACAVLAVEGDVRLERSRSLQISPGTTPLPCSWTRRRRRPIRCPVSGDETLEVRLSHPFGTTSRERDALAESPGLTRPETADQALAVVFRDPSLWTCRRCQQ